MSDLPRRTTSVMLLDWRKHKVGPLRPCRSCGLPAACRDEGGKPRHKVCAEREVVLAAYRPI